MILMKDLFIYKEKRKSLQKSALYELKHALERVEHLIKNLDEKSRGLETKESEPLSESLELDIETDQHKEQEKNKLFDLPQQPIKHKKEVIKQEIVLRLDSTNMPLKELKKEFVDIRKYCSKASFYRYVQELKKELKIEKISINEQQFLCLSQKY